MNKKDRLAISEQVARTAYYLSIETIDTWRVTHGEEEISFAFDETADRERFERFVHDPDLLKDLEIDKRKVAAYVNYVTVKEIVEKANSNWELIIRKRGIEFKSDDANDRKITEKVHIKARMIGLGD